jgi:hypothetical protein
MSLPSTLPSPNAASAAAHPSTNSSSAAILPRVPLVPDEILKRAGAFCSLDTRFRRAARLLQALWLKDHNIPTNTTIEQEGETTKTIGFASNLSVEAAEAGKNFLTPEIHQLVLRELLMREEGSAIDEDRLFGNALSSMPLTFNMFGPLALDLSLATAVFRRLLPEFVFSVDGIYFEHSPGRREPRFLHDGTAFDVAIRVTTPEGETAAVFIETKLSEDLSGPAARHRDRYDEASSAVHLFRDPDSPLLRSLALEQFWREIMLAQLIVDQGIVSRAVFMAIGPKLNRRVMTAFRVFQNELIEPERQDANRVAFEPLTLEAFIDAIDAAGAKPLAQALWARYCDFERVYQLSLQEIGGAAEPSSTNELSTTTESPSSNETALPAGRARRPLNSRTRARRRSTRVATNASSTGREAS